MLDAPFTAAELADIRSYQWPRQAWFALSGPLELGLSLAWLAWMVRPLYAAAERHAAWLRERVDQRFPGSAFGRVMERLWRGPGWGSAPLFARYDLLLFRALFLPADWYLGFVHEHAFGLSTQTAGGFAWDLLKGTSAEVLFTALLVFGLYGLARRTPRWWLLLGVPSALLLLGAAALDPYRSALYFTNDPLPQGTARDAVEATLARAGVAHAGVVVEHTGKSTRKLQAYFAGQGPTRRVVLNDALVEQLSPSEISAAVAHEAGHIHESRWPARFASSLAVLAFLWMVAQLQQEAARRGSWGMRDAADVRGFPAVTTLLLLLTLRWLRWGRRSTGLGTWGLVLAVLALVMMLPISQPIYGLVAPLQRIQFPWRWLGPGWFGALLWLCSPGSIPQAVSVAAGWRRIGLVLCSLGALGGWFDGLWRFRTNLVGHAPRDSERVSLRQLLACDPLLPCTQGMEALPATGELAKRFAALPDGRLALAGVPDYTPAGIPERSWHKRLQTFWLPAWPQTSWASFSGQGQAQLISHAPRERTLLLRADTSGTLRLMQWAHPAWRVQWRRAGSASAWGAPLADGGRDTDGWVAIPLAEGRWEIALTYGKRR